MDYLLLLLVFPLIGSLACLLNKKAAKETAFISSLITLAYAIVLLTKFVPDDSRQFVVDYPWIAQFGIHFKAGIDGISMIMVLLTTGLIPLIILSSFNRTFKNSSALYALILFMQFGLLIVFTALDGFLFYVGWEIALIPIYFICAIWGGVDRIRVNMKFFIYTFAGSLFMLLGIIYLHLQTTGNSYDIDAFYALDLDSVTQGWLFWCFFIAFAIKMPIFPFHTWQPDTYTTAPTMGTMLLAGIMLKMGIYGVIRWLIPIVPIGFMEWKQLVIILSIIGIVYASIIAFKQKEIKRLVAYSSIAHVGLIAAGIFAWNAEGVQGGMIQMLNHGINVIGLFFAMDIIIDRLNTQDSSQMGGIAKVAPKFAIALLIIILGTVALPLTNGFIGEFLLLNAVYQYQIWFAAVAGLTIIFGAVYMLRMYKHVMQGELNELTSKFRDIKGSEVLVMGIICALIIIIGVYPKPILNISAAAVDTLIVQVNSKLAF
ncbi:NADH dehydrogenase [Pedobacter psychrophilus]|uniref:NADH dehydrogenase n=1 Tax=Pedobacter psychrophilus TaxID=1826909 RepID=A0A179DCK0_9SPHI|nr:NADH-quinone oxidoreductase subunit M [Pedobacter psychrophilus]OAQ38430.1 NADH dehydrogenase [Pedobacter psychrophilus]